MHVADCPPISRLVQAVASGAIAVDEAPGRGRRNFLVSVIQKKDVMDGYGTGKGAVFSPGSAIGATCGFYAISVCAWRLPCRARTRGVSTVGRRRPPYRE